MGTSPPRWSWRMASARADEHHTYLIAQMKDCWHAVTCMTTNQVAPIVGEVTSDQLAAASATFGLLSVPGRLHLVWLLASGEFDVTTLAELTGAAIPATSQQLAKLRAAGVVAARREGRRQLYRVDDAHILTVVEQMLSHIEPDGTIREDHVGPRSPAHLPRQPRPPRRPRFDLSPPSL